LANSEGNQEYLGIDSNVLRAYLVPKHPAPQNCKIINDEKPRSECNGRVNLAPKSVTILWVQVLAILQFG